MTKLSKCKNCGHHPNVNEPPIPTTVVIVCSHCADIDYQNSVVANSYDEAVDLWNEEQEEI